LLLQVAVSMVVNLYVTVPTHHPGARPSEYFSGSLRRVAWALSSGLQALMLHAALGLAVGATSLVLAVRAVTSWGGWVAALAVLAAAMGVM
jgi:hypothetical protein